MKAIVIGGTGATGKQLVEQLLSTEWISEVTLLLRKPTDRSHPKLRQVTVDFDHLKNYREVIAGDIAFSCLGTTLKAAGSKEAQWKVDYGYQLQFAEIARNNGIGTFVLLSAQNADAKSIFFYSKMKGELEKSMEALHFDKLIILQPGLLLRPGSDRFAEKVMVSLLSAFNRMGLLRKLAPLPVSRVAAAMIGSINRCKDAVTRVNNTNIKAWSE